MSPKRQSTRKAEPGEARGRLRVAEKYLEAAELMSTDSDRYAINVSVGTAVLAGIAASDAICVAGIGARYSGTDHAAAADVLNQVEAAMGKRLRRLIGLKPASHYGDKLLSERDRASALREAQALVDRAREVI